MNSTAISTSKPTEQVSPATGAKLPAGAGYCAELRTEAGGENIYSRVRGVAADSLVVALFSPLAVLTSDLVPRILLAVVIFDIPFEFGTHLFYREREAAVGALGGLSISATTLALAGLYLTWFIRTHVKKTSEARPSLHINLPLLLYFLVAAISVAAAQDVRLSLFEVALLLEACLIYFYVANNVRTRQDVVYAVKLLMIACLLVSLANIVLEFTGMPSTIWGAPTQIQIEADPRQSFMRVGGTIGSPNFAAAYFSISLAAAAGILFTNLGRALKWLAIAVLGLAGVALIFTFSRGGWVAAALAVSLICWVGYRRRGFSLKAPIAILLVLGLLCLPFQNVISARLLGDDKGSAESRVPLMKLALRIFEDNPLLGVGANNFTVVMDRYLTSDFREGWLFTVHNKYLLVLAETGIVGLLAFLAFLLDALRKGWQCWLCRDPLLSPIALGLTVGIAAHMLHMTVDVFRGRPTQQLLWLMAGLLVAMLRICRSNASADRFSYIT
ncbi:MAG TPA: O-antigen ligase family protein [Candidatus Acidoferrum sp.]|nr:O-antigen ligase family protein [Candidatus Acidoferrum sp.]